MSVEPIRCQLTANDLAILEAILDRLPDASDPLGVLLRAKLTVADVYPSGAIPPDVVTINSHVTYRVDGRNPHTVVVVQDELPSEDMPHMVSIHRPLGLALLGLAEGDTAIVISENGWPRAVSVEKVVSKRGHRASGVISFRARQAPLSMDWSDDDDPGPTAA
jgi:regulator of nucleoside diphosphate kinase